MVTARARYGRWIGGTLPTFIPVPLAGKASAKARKGGKVAERQGAGADGEEEEYSIRLKQLRCGGCLRLHACVFPFLTYQGYSVTGKPKWRPHSHTALSYQGVEIAVAYKSKTHWAQWILLAMWQASVSIHVACILS